MFHDAYRGKRVLVTGHTGFKGSWLCLWLMELGAKVTGFAQEPYTSEDTFVRTKLGEKINDERGELRDLAVLKKIFQEHEPEVVFHLAAQPIVRLSYDKPLETFEVNSIGTANVLEAVRATDSVEAAVMITTDKVYENRERIWGYRENEPLGGHDPYSASKACAEIIIASYRKSFFSEGEGSAMQPKVASARAGNVLGGGDWQQDRLVPDCIRGIWEGNPIQIRNPAATRPWQHVLDALGGYLLLGEKLLGDEGGQYAEAWNFGPTFEAVIPVGDLVQKLVDAWGKGMWEDLSSTKDAKHEAKLLSLDISKAISRLDWYPVLSLDECLQFTVEWYREALQHPDQDMATFTRGQIQEFAQRGRAKSLGWLGMETLN